MGICERTTSGFGKAAVKLLFDWSELSEGFWFALSGLTGRFIAAF
jgi:hypothetical protein